MVDPVRFRQVLGGYPTGVCVVTALDRGGARQAMVVGSFCSISLDPPLVGFFPAKSSASWQGMAESEAFCINVLGAGQAAHCTRFTARSKDRFTGLDLETSPGGLPRLADALAWIDCTLDRIHDLGDHWLVVGRVRALDALGEGDPMIFFRGRYRNLGAELEA
ncbi:flavin reductase family protein [Novosphingobium flavum]|uniref:Flavin reductase family protein n=1 Tax=Novosphingobium flavum TaxID=1778672 RepID=A0A7X1FU50_9SPHN|nr:flavin reductase family protein [Novosphingobium flavum]